MELRQLLDDTLFWIANKTFPAEEISIRLKHRIVQIHCFCNGNGRHSRLLADIVISHIFGGTVFSWGTGSLSQENDARRDYLRAIKQADKGDISPLIQFARS
jgi:fido (protein-threonine AMPylation protein)